MAFTLVKASEYINEKGKIKNEKGELLFDMDFILSEDETNELYKLVSKGALTTEEEMRTYEIVFKDRLEEADQKIGLTQMTQVVFFMYGRAKEKLGLDSMKIMSNATTKLQNKLKK